MVQQLLPSHQTAHATQTGRTQDGSGDDMQLRPPLETPVVTISRTHSDSFLHRPPSTPTAGILDLQGSCAVGTSTSHLAIQTTPAETDLRPARPHYHRAASTSIIATPVATSTPNMSQPNLLRRVTQQVSQQLELGQSSAAAQRKKPASPTYWSEAHRQYLLLVWDKTVEIAASSTRYPQSSSAHLNSTYNTLMRKFPELARGQVPLSGEWLEYELGIALRHPFCTADRMGRWEILAATGGARGTWGPW